MKTQIKDLPIAGSKLLVHQVSNDIRGSFEVFWEQADFADVDLMFRPSNAHHSYNSHAGTIRAFHLQRPPHGQSKLVSCVSGKAWDVILDLRPESPTFRHWESIDLSASSGNAVYIPVGCAHGFATLQDNTTIAYLIEGEYQPDFATVVRWNDPTLRIDWPVSNPILSDKDLQAADLDSYMRSLR